MREEIAWFKDSVIYHVFIDRFAGVRVDSKPNQPDFCGGNLKALTEKIPYFKKLGVNTLLISPLMEGVAYHGYHITDFFSVDPHFGTKEDLIEFLKIAHKNNLKILLDFVPNHVSQRHPFFVKARTNELSRYRKWFYFNDSFVDLLKRKAKGESDDSYLSFLGFKDLPKLNLDYEPCRNYVVGAAQFWLDLGFDGLRLDHVLGPSISFWKHFSNKLNESHPSAVLIGELWGIGWDIKQWPTLLGVKNKLFKLMFAKEDNYIFLKDYFGILDGCLDFTFNKIFRDYISGKITHEIAYGKLQKHYAKFPKDFFLPTFLDNHDMDRILFLANQDIEKLKELATWQFKIKQPPIIYYGTELGMTQIKPFSSVSSHGDLLARQPMSWQDAGNELFNFYKLLIAQKNRRLRTEDDLTKDIPKEFLLRN